MCIVGYIVGLAILVADDAEIRPVAVPVDSVRKPYQNRTASSGTCLETCCYALADPHEYHMGSGLDMFDRFSATEAKNIADVYYGRLGRPSFSYYTDYHDHLIPCLQNGTIIFVDTCNIDHFMRITIPKFPSDLLFVLVSGDSDVAVPSGTMFNEIHDHPSIIKWYAMNCDRYNLNSDTFECIPIGVSQWADAREYLQKAYELDYLSNNKTFKALVAFTVSNHKDRRVAYRHFCHRTSFTNCLNSFPSMMEYYNIVSRTQFVISPHGVGIDCYRTYESLAMGAYVVVKKSPLDIIYKTMPVLIVDEWTDVTEELLDKTYKEFQQKSFDLSPIYSRFYQQKWMKYRGHDKKFFYYRRSDAAININGY